LEEELRVCFFILSSFDFDSRARLICRDIISAGWELDIIAATGATSESFRGARIHRIPQPVKPFRQRRFIEYNLKAAKIAAKLNADIYHAVDLDTLWAAARAARATGGKVIYEARELYTELLALKDRYAVKAFWKILEKRFIHHANAIITINDSIADELVKRYGIERPQVAMNVAEVKPIAKPIDLRRQFNLDSKFILVYQGVLRPGQGILRALQILSGLPDTGLVIIGEGPVRHEIENEAARLDIAKRIRFAGMVEPDELPRYTAGGDAGLLLMEAKAMNNYLALPQKLFQYIAAGVPPIVTGLPELAKIVGRDRLGLVLDRVDVSNDVAAVGGFLAQGLNDAKKACHEAQNKYNWDIEGGKIMAVYRGLL
jgi:glycosyltransferase involved in cell wall biosynthesis